MTDVFSRQKRSEIMRSVRGKDTQPEITVRRLLHGLGYRYRLHVRTLPGNPDIVFPARKKVILVHGCFWHRHRCRDGRSMPVVHKSFWAKKFSGNRLRDQKNRNKLRRLNWAVLVVWECQLRSKDLNRLAIRLREFLDSALPHTHAATHGRNAIAT